MTRSNGVLKRANSLLLMMSSLKSLKELVCFALQKYC